MAPAAAWRTSGTRPGWRASAAAIRGPGPCSGSTSGPSPNRARVPSRRFDRRSQPALPLHPDIDADHDRRGDAPEEQIAEVPAELGHVALLAVEVHAVEAGEEGERQEEDRDHRHG